MDLKPLIVIVWSIFMIARGKLPDPRRLDQPKKRGGLELAEKPRPGDGFLQVWPWRDYPEIPRIARSKSCGQFGY
jgi:hypothetical protein